MLLVDIRKRVGQLRIDVKFEETGRVIGLFGASGAGKTTVVNMIAGLVKPDDGMIVCDGETLFHAQQRVNVPPHRRRIGYVFQEGRLFPHLTVAQNLDYGRWMNSIAPNPAERARIVELLDIAPLLPRRPGKLSGGERQRVAIGRALMTKPKLLLLDEPLASLDTGRKKEIMPYLIRLRDDAGIPMVYVSHHPAEMRMIANVVVHIDGGRVTACGGPELIDAENPFIG